MDLGRKVWRQSGSEIGDHLSWSSEAGRVSGTIIAMHRKVVDYKGHRHHASEEDPGYEIKTDHVALRKGSALRKRTIVR